MLLTLKFSLLVLIDTFRNRKVFTDGTAVKLEFTDKNSL